MTALRLLRQKQILRNQAKPLNAVPVLAAPLLAKQLRLSRQARQAATGFDTSHYVSAASVAAEIAAATRGLPGCCFPAPCRECCDCGACARTFQRAFGHSRAPARASLTPPAGECGAACGDPAGASRARKRAEEAHRRRRRLTGQLGVPSGPPGARKSADLARPPGRASCVAHDRLRAQEARLKTAGARQGHGVVGVAQGGFRPQQEQVDQSGQIRCSIVVSISACHAEDPGSIPGGGGIGQGKSMHRGVLRA